MNSLVRLLETPVIHPRQLWRRFSLLLVCLLAVCIAPWPKAHAQEVFNSGFVGKLLNVHGNVIFSLAHQTLFKLTAANNIALTPYTIMCGT